MAIPVALAYILTNIGVTAATHWVLQPTKVADGTIPDDLKPEDPEVLTVTNNYTQVNNSYTLNFPNNPTLTPVNLPPSKLPIEGDGQTDYVPPSWRVITLENKLIDVPYGKLLYNPLKEKVTVLEVDELDEQEERFDEAQSIGQQAIIDYLVGIDITTGEALEAPNVDKVSALFIPEEIKGFAGKYAVLYGPTAIAELNAAYTRRALQGNIPITSEIYKEYRKIHPEKPKPQQKEGEYKEGKEEEKTAYSSQLQLNSDEYLKLISLARIYDHLGVEIFRVRDGESFDFNTLMEKFGNALNMWKKPKEEHTQEQKIGEQIQKLLAEDDKKAASDKMDKGISENLKNIKQAFEDGDKLDTLPDISIDFLNENLGNLDDFKPKDFDPIYHSGGWPVDNLVDLFCALSSGVFWKSGLHELPGEVPSSLIGDGANVPVQILNSIKLQEWLIQNLDGLFGYFPQEITIKDADPYTNGEQTQVLRFENIAEYLSEIFNLSREAATQADVANNILMRLIPEIAAILNCSLITQDLVNCNAQYLGYDRNPIDREIEFNFNITDVKDIDSLLTEKKMLVKGWKFEDKETLTKHILKAALATEILRLVFVRDKDQLNNLTKNLDDQNDQKWDDFERMLEDPNSLINEDHQDVPKIVVDYKKGVPIDNQELIDGLNDIKVNK